MKRILVIGGTGTVGRQVVSQLLQRGEPVRVMTRNPEDAGFPPQVEVVCGDLTVPDTLEACLQNIGAVFLVWVAPPPSVVSAIERIARHARRIVFLSAPLKTAHPLFQQPNPGRSLGLQIERQIEASGIPWTFLRPGMFAPNAKEWWGPQIRAGQPVRWPCLEVPTAPIDERDIAAVGILALCEDGHAGAEYVLTGPESLSQLEQVRTIGGVIGRSLQVEGISPDEARRELLSIMPAPVINMLLDAWIAAKGRPAFVSSTFEEITGMQPRSFLTWATDNAAQFRA